MTLEVVEIYGGGGVGGAAQHLRLLVQGLRERGVAVTFLSLPPHSIASDMEAIGAPTVRAPSFGGALRALAEHPRALLHAHGTRALVVALAAQRPFVRTVHSFLASDYRDPLRRLLATAVDRMALARAVKVIAVSEALRAELLRRGVPPERVVAVANGAAPAPPPKARRELAALGGWTEDVVLLFMASRLDPVKGVDRAVRALALLPEARLVIFGQGPWEAELRREAEAVGVADRLVLAGYSREARAFLGAADLVLIPSRQEGMPFVALEALAAGVPVVATDLPGLREALGDAAVFTSGEPEALAAGVREALKARAALAERARRRFAAEFACDVFVERTLAVLRAADAARRGRRSLGAPP